jgi:hypothetical protein
MALLFNILTNKMRSAKYNKTQFLLSVNSYMFRHRSAILREFHNHKVSYLPTRALGASRPQFHN